MSKNAIKVSIVVVILLIIISILGNFIITNQENVKKEESKSYGRDNFSMKFLELENSEQNIIYSPLSIKYGLKMLSEGASGNTKTQIDNLIGGINLKQYDNIDKVLSLANALYIKDVYIDFVKESYKKTLSQKYKVEINYDSFGSAKNINDWIERKTLGIMKDMIKDDLVQNPNCKMLLINALGIDMDWVIEFDSKDTNGEKFYLKDGTEMTATTMNKKTSSDNISYYKDNSITALTMDLQKYDNVQLEFMSIMPHNNLNQYLQTLTISEIDSIAKKMKKASESQFGIDISIPKFSFDYELNFEEDLKNLGITDAFDEELANFSNMTMQKLYINEAIHKADIKFTEDGIEAAASTVIVFYDNSITIGEQTIAKEIKIDKPFLFLIRNKETNEIWFIGTVYEPNNWEKDKSEYQ